MCGESWLATKHLNPPPEFSRLGIQVSLAIIIFVCLGYGRQVYNIIIP